MSNSTTSLTSLSTSQPISTTSTTSLISTTSTTTSISSPSVEPPSSTSITSLTTSPTSEVETVTQSGGGTTTIQVTVTPPTKTNGGTKTSSTLSSTSGSTNTSSPDGSKSGGGLEGSALIAVAVIVPIVIIALLVVGALLFFRKRKDRRSKISLKGAPGLGLGGTGAAVGMAPTNSNSDDGGYEMARGGEGSGYRGWGSTGGGRKSTGLASSVGTAYPMASVTGRSVSEGSYNNNSDMYGLSTTPAGVGSSSVNINAPLLDRPAASPAFTEGSIIGAMPTFDSRNDGLNRGISNASSNYSAMTHSDQSDYHAQSYYSGEPQEYGASYFVNGPGLYSDDPVNPPPVIRDVQARRNTRIETPTGTHQTGSSGIAQNF
ncbi:hypothetical protein DFH27DRAFT_247999 [Peziza echinospora]|nr:hypothetical protein DFH27DRAFT_247999 [Peziza echinospora]